MFCNKCGNTVVDGATFCHVCGQTLGQATLPPALSATFQTPPPVESGPLVSPPPPVSPHWLPVPTVSYAGFWLRFVAHLIDGLVIAIPSMILFVVIFLLAGGAAYLRQLPHANPPDPDDPAIAFAFMGIMIAMAGVGIIIGWLYYAYSESSSWQATLGKRTLNLIVTDLNGNRLSFGRATGRFFAKWITGLIPLGIGYIMAGFTERKQALHDMIASTLVLRRL